MTPETCTRCGWTLAPEDTQCPKCRLPIRRDGLTPLGGPGGRPPVVASPRDAHQEREDVYRSEPAGPAEGQEWPGSWGYIKHIAKQDPLIAIVMALLALNVLVNIGNRSPLGMVVSGAIFWGVFTFQAYGYWLALIGSGLGLLLAFFAFALSPPLGLILGATPAFTFVVLLLRKEYFR